MRAAAEAFDKIVRTRPDFGKEATEYHVAMVDTLSWLTDEELAWLTDPRSGLHTVCKYLPTAADVHEFLRNKRAKLEQFKPAPTHYHKAEPLAGPWDAETDYERKRRVVRDALGYNPDTKPIPPRPVLPDDWSASDLKTPAAPPSPHLLKLLATQRPDAA